MSEGEGSVTFFIQNQNPNLEREIVVEITTTYGTAIGNSPLPVVARGFGLNMSAVYYPDGVDYIGISETVSLRPVKMCLQCKSISLMMRLTMDRRSFL